MPFRKPNTLIVLRHEGGWTLCAPDLAPAAAEVNVDPKATPAEAAQTLADALVQLQLAGTDVLLALPSQACYCAPITAGEGSRKDKRGPLIFRLEEKLPLAAEDIAADFILRGDGALGVCVPTADIAPMVEALESAGMRVDRISPAILLALQSLEVSASQCDAHLWSDGTHLDLVVMAGQLPQLWYRIAANATDVTMYLQSAARSTPLRVALRHVPRQLIETISKLPGVDVVATGDQTIPQAIRRGADALTGGAIPLWINLRRDSLAPPDALRRFRRPLAGVAVGLLLLLACTTAALFWRANRYERLALSYDDELRAVFRQALPGRAIPSTPRLRLASEERKLRALAGGPEGVPQSLAMRVFYEALARLPRNAGFRVTEMRLAEDRFTLEGQAKSHADAESVAAALRKGDVFHVELPRSEQVGRGDGAVTFSLIAVLENPRRAKPLDQSKAQVEDTDWRMEDGATASSQSSTLHPRSSIPGKENADYHSGPEEAP